MRKLSFLFIFSLALLITVAPAFPAALAINLVGKWQGTQSRLTSDGTSAGTTYHNSEPLYVRVIIQNGDRFDGEISNDGVNWKHFIGVISEGKLMMTNADAVIYANVPFLEQGIFRMAGVFQRIAKDAGNFETGKFTVHRTSPTP